MGNKTLAMRMAMGTPSNYSKTANGELMTFWRYHPKPNACKKCQAMKGLWFAKKPGPVHPNCKCEIEMFRSPKPSGNTNKIVVPPDVDLEANIAEARRVAKEIERKAHERYSKLYFAEGAVQAELNEIFLVKIDYIRKNFAEGMKYDYKKDGREYENFGNYHFGLYVNAMGIMDIIAKVGAGAYQVEKKRSDCKGITDWTFEALMNYCDQSIDMEMIIKGQNSPLLHVNK